MTCCFTYVWRNTGVQTPVEFVEQLRDGGEFCAVFVWPTRFGDLSVVIQLGCFGRRPLFEIPQVVSQRPRYVSAIIIRDLQVRRRGDPF